MIQTRNKLTNSSIIVCRAVRTIYSGLDSDLKNKNQPTPKVLFGHDKQLSELELMFFEKNKMEVRAIYRELLKKTSQAIPRKLEREA